MGPDSWGMLSSRLASLDGWPDWGDENTRNNYFEGLCDVPDILIGQMARGLLRRYPKRPSVKDLRDWAATLAPARTFEVAPPGRQLPSPEARRPCPPPERVRQVFAALKAGQRPDAPPDALAGDWGLAYDYPNGKTERMPARWSKAEALRRVQSWNEHWSPHHSTARVYQREAAPTLGRTMAEVAK